MAGSRERADWAALLWLRRQRIRGRSGFIWGFVVVRFALPVTLAATVLRVLTEPFRWGHMLAHLAANVGIAGVGGGYLAGVVAWELLVGPQASARGRIPPRRRRSRQ
jgi:hypothetical protein